MKLTHRPETEPIKYLEDIDIDSKGIILVYQYDAPVGYITSTDSVWYFYNSLNSDDVIQSDESSFTNLVYCLERQYKNISFEFFNFNKAK